jgi:tetratricopeptide (TPR) repeat protein
MPVVKLSDTGEKKMNAKSIVRGATFLLFIFVLSMPLLVSCKKKEEQPVSSPAQNPYSNESIFFQVKQELAKNPNDPDALYHLADLYDRNSQYPEAIETYQKVVKLKPDMGYAYFKIGTAYDRLNQPEKAIEAFKEAAKHMPAYAVIYNNMGVAYGNLRKFDEEVASLKKAIQLRPRYSAARFNLGVTYMKLGNRKAAMKEYEELRKFDEGAAAALLKEIKGKVAQAGE